MISFETLKHYSSDFSESFAAMLKKGIPVGDRFDKMSRYVYSPNSDLAVDPRTDRNHLKYLCTDKSGLTVSIVLHHDAWDTQKKLMVWTQHPDDEYEGVEVDFFSVGRTKHQYVLICDTHKAPSVLSLLSRFRFSRTLESFI